MGSRCISSIPIRPSNYTNSTKSQALQNLATTTPSKSTLHQIPQEAKTLPTNFNGTFNSGPWVNPGIIPCPNGNVVLNDDASLWESASCQIQPPRKLPAYPPKLPRKQHGVFKSNSMRNLKIIRTMTPMHLQARCQSNCSLNDAHVITKR